MAKVEKSVLVMHSCAEMFNLVDAVESYPQFLPWCGGVDVVERNELHTWATIHIAYMGIKQHFSTLNSKHFPERMEMQLKDGPFKTMEGYWQFTPLNEKACKIQFMLHYEFSNSLLEKLIAPVFSQIIDTFVDNFVTQADKIAASKSQVSKS